MHRYLKTAAWSSLEYLFYPLLMIAAAPIMVKSIGEADYGLVLLASAVSGLGGAANLGMGAATIRFVSARLGVNDREGAIEAARATLALGGLAAVLVALAVAACTPFLAARPLSGMGEPGSTRYVLYCAAALLLLSQLDGILNATLKGAERFKLSAQVEMVCKLVTVGATVLTARIAGQVEPVLFAMIVVQSLTVIAKTFVVGRPLGCRWLWPRLGPAALTRELARFGAWNWLQGLAGVLFSHADRLLVGALLGASALTYYSVCLQMTQLTHTVPAAAMTFLFPLVSRRSAQTDRQGMNRIAALGIGMSLALSLAFGLFLFVFGHQVLGLWMGREFATNSAGLLPWLTVAFLLLSLNIAPYYLLTGRGYVRFVSMINLAGSGIGLIAAWILMPFYGLVGAAFARIVLGITMLLTYPKLFTTRASS